MNKILIAIVALIVVFGAFIFLGNKKAPMKSTQESESTKSQQKTPTATQTNSQVANVILGSSGFVPKNIIVKTGTRVIWTNSSGQAATVSSDYHPTHRLYPFLNLGELANGTTVQVVVEKSGKYGYHNHLNASEIGTITVE